MQTYTGKIQEIGPRDIFVFTSNLQGFHGAGSAGFASFGKEGNHWREFEYDKKPNGWRGILNVKGCSEGLQTGTKGWSYAIPTVVKPGLKRSIPLGQIFKSIQNLYECARRNLDWNFLIAFTGSSKKINLSGYSNVEFAALFAKEEIPDNLVFEENFAKLIGRKNSNV